MSARKVSAQQGLLKRCIVVPVALALLATGCGFHLPNQAKLDDTMPEVVVTGDYHDQFYKLVVRRLRANGVTVYAQDSGYSPTDDERAKDLPTLILPRPNVLDEVVSVNSRAQSLEYALVVSVAPTLAIPNHRPIMMRNSVTRSVLNKPGQALASDTEKAIVIQETKEDLADQLVMRLSYLGRSSDPDASVPQPAELILAQGESSAQDTAAVTQATTQTQGMTLLEALQQQDQYESAQGTQLTLDQLNNGQRILNNKSYELPKVKPEPLHQAPEHLY
ncbi:MAG: hypothetical protein ROM54_00970 [Anaerobiospirillum sp.]|nr:hypothetical protein [Anaerobiospirillum sp.]